MVYRHHRTSCHRQGQYVNTKSIGYSKHSNPFYLSDKEQQMTYSMHTIDNNPHHSGASSSDRRISNRTRLKSASIADSEKASCVGELRMNGSSSPVKKFLLISKCNHQFPHNRPKNAASSLSRRSSSINRCIRATKGRPPRYLEDHKMESKNSAYANQGKSKNKSEVAKKAYNVEGICTWINHHRPISSSSLMSISSHNRQSIGSTDQTDKVSLSNRNSAEYKICTVSSSSISDEYAPIYECYGAGSQNRIKQTRRIDKNQKGHRDFSDEQTAYKYTDRQYEHENLRSSSKRQSSATQRKAQCLTKQKVGATNADNRGERFMMNGSSLANVHSQSSSNRTPQRVLRALDKSENVDSINTQAIRCQLNEIVNTKSCGNILPDENTSHKHENIFVAISKKSQLDGNSNRSVLDSSHQDVYMLESRNLNNKYHNDSIKFTGLLNHTSSPIIYAQASNVVELTNNQYGEIDNIDGSFQKKKGKQRLCDQELLKSYLQKYMGNTRPYLENQQYCVNDILRCDEFVENDRNYLSDHNNRASQNNKNKKGIGSCTPAGKRTDKVLMDSENNNYQKGKEFTPLSDSEEMHNNINNANKDNNRILIREGRKNNPAVAELLHCLDSTSQDAQYSDCHYTCTNMPTRAYSIERAHEQERSNIGYPSTVPNNAFAFNQSADDQKSFGLQDDPIGSSQGSALLNTRISRSNTNNSSDTSAIKHKESFDKMENGPISSDQYKYIHTSSQNGEFGVLRNSVSEADDLNDQEIAAASTGTTVQYEILDEHGNTLQLQGDIQKLMKMAGSVKEIVQDDGTIVKEYILDDPNILNQLHLNTETRCRLGLISKCY